MSSRLRITRVEAILLQFPLPRDFRGSVYSVTSKNAIVTRLHTDHGPLGECVNGEGNAEMLRQTHRILEQELAPLLLGADPLAIEALWPQLWRATMRGNRDHRAAVRAVACADSALWDIVGKVAGLPLYRLWGGARDTLPIIAIGGQYRADDAQADQAADVEQEIAELQALGLAGCKFKVGGRTPAQDAARLAIARRAGGDGFVLCADANRGWRRSEALDFAQRARDLGLEWFEEPCHWHNDRRDMALVRSQTGLRIAAGQSESSAEGCRDLMLDNAIDVCNLDASWGGGPTVWLRVAKLAACFGLEMAHHGEPVVGSHLLASQANGTYVETHHPERDPVFHQLLVGRGSIGGGQYTLPNAPGWGVGFDADMLAHHRLN